MHKIFNKTFFIGKKACYLPSCHSTNDVASTLIANESPIDGTVIYTSNQTAGKGQRGNRWESEEGKNLTFSVMLKTGFLDPSENFFLTRLTALAIHDLLTEYLREGLKIKWPNDIVCFDQKLAGILIENYIKQNKMGWSVLGIGLNVNQSRFSVPTATSLSMLCGQQFDLEELLALLLSCIERRYFQLKSQKYQELKNDYLERLYWKDEIHVFRTGAKYFNGRIIGVNEAGKLKVEKEEDTDFFDFKEIQFVR